MLNSTTRRVELVIGGMTCASCAARIEKKLNKVPGVTASVNYATEKAKVHYTSEVQPEDLVATVEATGYTASLPSPPVLDQSGAEVAQRSKDEEAAAWAQRLTVSAGPHGPCDRHVDDPGPPVRQLAVDLTHPRIPCRGLGGSAVPSGRRGRTCGIAPPPWTR